MNLDHPLLTGHHVQKGYLCLVRLLIVSLLYLDELLSFSRVVLLPWKPSVPSRYDTILRVIMTIPFAIFQKLT